MGLAIPFSRKISFALYDLCDGSGPTLGNLLALVDLSNFLLEELVTLLANLDDLLALNAQSYRKTLECMALRTERRRDTPETASSTLCEIWAAVLYLVKVSGLLRV